MKPLIPPVVSLALSAATATSLRAEESETWEPPPPPADEFDWVQLTSGEWLKGEFRVMYDEEVKFVSDKLGFLTLD